MNLPPDTYSAFEALLDYLKQNCGVDLTGYQRSSLMRRVHYRMKMLPIESYSNYIKYIDECPQEVLHLRDTIDINFTGFFRNSSTWDYLATNIIPQIIASKSSDEPIRVWSAGCASGEETYCLAILLAEALGVEQFCSRVQIFGTDVDEQAVNQARQASYNSSKITNIPDHLLNKYFEKADGCYVFLKDLSRRILFNKHNLILDAPMSKIDLLACRNVLIYFNLETQVRVLARFHFALKNNGFLLLGNTELVPSEITSLYRIVNLEHHLFTKLPAKLHSRLLIKALKRT